MKPFILTFPALIVMTILMACSFVTPPAEKTSVYQTHAYPKGSDALPLLREIWDFGADTIFPKSLAQRFDATTLKQLEDTLRADNTMALADILNPFFDSLGISHTRLYDRRHQGYYMLRSLFSTRDLNTPALYTIGVQLNDRAPGNIQAVLHGSPAARAKLRRGDRIIAVNGAPFESLLQWQQAGPVNLTIENENGKHNITLTPVRQGFHRALANATQASQTVIECSDRRIGYIHLWAGTHPVFLDILNRAVNNARASQLDGYILDLRDGFGGAGDDAPDPLDEAMGALGAGIGPFDITLGR